MKDEKKACWRIRYKVSSEPVTFTEGMVKRLLKAALKRLIFADNSFNVYVGGVGVSLQRNWRVRFRHYCAGRKLCPAGFTILLQI